MKKIKYLITTICMFLIVSIPIVFAYHLGVPDQPSQIQNFPYSQGVSGQQVPGQPYPTGPFYSNPNPYSTPASFQTDPYFGGNLGGYVYNNPAQDAVRRATGGYSYGPEQYLGEAIIINVADYEPKQVRESLLEQQDVPVFVYLKGTTVGTLLSPFTNDPTARDPLSGITEIPPIDYIDVRPNITSNLTNYLRFANYIPPRRDRYSLDNLGYLIVYLRKLESENQTPPNNTITLDLNAKIYLKLQESNLFGVSQQSLVLKQFQNESEFLSKKDDYKFFSGKGYIKATRIGTDSVTLQIYNRDLYPLAIATPTQTASTTGVVPNSVITLRKGETSAPISFRYTGNPLNDLFQVRLDDVSIPADKAEIEYEINGKKLTRKIPVGARLHPTSSWIVAAVNNNDTIEITASNIESEASRLNLNVQQKNQIIALINNNQKPIIEKHRLELQNQATGERKIIVREVITKGGESLKYDYQVINKDTADFLFKKYCESNDNVEPQVTNDNAEPQVTKDIGCEAARRYKQIINDYPNSPEATKSKKDLAELYADYLIGFIPCTRTLPGGTLSASDQNLCREFQFDMSDLALYYYSQIGEQDTIVDRFGSSGGEDYLQNEGVSIKLKRVITAKQDQPLFSLRVYAQNGQYFESQGIGVGDFLNLTNQNQNTQVNYRNAPGNYFWRVESINPSSITVRLVKEVNAAQKTFTPTGEISTLKIDEPKQIETLFQPLNQVTNQPTGPSVTTNVLVTKIDSRYEAYVTVLPGAGRAFTTSNFRVNIPVDPRPFKWTPEQLESQINTTRSLIADLDKIINKLDSYVSTLKKLCLGVFAFLTLKNAFGGTRNIARRQVATHFKERCQREVREGRTAEHQKFNTADECLDHYGDEITSSTDKTEKYIDDINNKVKGKTADDLINDQSLASSGEMQICGNFTEFRQASIGVNNADVVRQYRDCLLDAKIQSDTTLSARYRDYARSKSNEIGTKARTELYRQAVDFATHSNGQWDPNNATQMQDIIVQLQEINEIQRNQNVNQPYRIRLTNSQAGNWAGVVLAANPASQNPSQALTSVNVRGLSRYDQIILDSGGNQDTAKATICSQIGGDIQNNICKRNGATVNLSTRIDQLKSEPAYSQTGSPFQAYVDNRFFTATHLGDTASYTAITDQTICANNGGEWHSGTTSGTCTPKIYSTTSTLDTAGRILNTAYAYGGDLAAQYDQEGLAYCYPTGNGEYVLVLDRFPNRLIKQIRVMNVGSNGRIECGSGDDEIAQGGDETALSVNPTKRQTYISKEPRRCIKEGDIVGYVDGRTVKCSKSNIESLNTLTQPKCIDVMDPTDCKWLFNFCDPVMCPSSRCTFGGRIHPRNVIQSGVIGSLLLCAPNFNQGIYLPVCLTGVDAGLKNIRSILEGYANCLEINLKQGKNVGFCDYIRSVGICEMVWKEAYNLLDIGGRGIIDWASGKLIGQPQGGGEYLAFQSSLDNVGNSVNVFTQEYSSTYTAQFLSQSTEQIGTQICRLSVNGKLPAVGKILDQITEPENPPQFTAFFDEVPYAAPGESPGLPTVPVGTQELSLYKTFYHIYAGTGFYQGSYSQPTSLLAPGTQLGAPQPTVYSVYLINREMGLPPLYVTMPGDFVQFQGRLEAGKYAQQSVQKIGAKGYNQICVNINGIEQCGFGRVSSSFGLNEIKDLVTKEEAAGKIDSAEKCVPSSQKTQGQSLAALGALAGAELTGGGVGTGVVTSGVVETNLYSRGIVRVCGVGAPTEETVRWQKVGTCGYDEHNKTRGDCWLDVKSVRIEDTKLNNDLISEIRRRAGANVNLIDEERSKEILYSLNQERNNLIDAVRSLVQKAKRTQTAAAPPGP